MSLELLKQYEADGSEAAVESPPIGVSTAKDVLNELHSKLSEAQDALATELAGWGAFQNWLKKDEAPAEDAVPETVDSASAAEVEDDAKNETFPGGLVEEVEEDGEAGGEVPAEDSGSGEPAGETEA